MNLYKTETTRKWLKEVCKLADENFGLISVTIPIFGTGTCSEVFEAKLEQVKEEKPDYFVDESKEKNLEDIQKELQTLKMLVDQVSQNTLENKQNLSQLDEINDMLNRTNNKVSAQLKTMEEQIQYVQGQIKNQNIEQNVPNDLMARIIFNIPIFGRLLKSFLDSSYINFLSKCSTFMCIFCAFGDLYGR